MAKQGYPASGSRYGHHPSVGGYPVAGSRYGSHPSGGPPPAFGPLDPLSIVTSVSAYTYLIADLGVTDAGGGLVAAWADQSGGAIDSAQGVGASQPLLQAASLGDKNTILFDGAADFLNFAAFTRGNPSITPSFYWVVFRQVSWVSQDTLFGATATGHRLYQLTASPGLTQRNGGVVNGPNNDAPVGDWSRGEISFTGSVSDYTKFKGGAPFSLGNSGTTGVAAGAFSLGAYSAAGTSPVNAEIACFTCWDGAPTAGELSDLDAWATGYYNGLVGI